MTGGRVMVLGQTGKNFGAGMSGGFAYVFDQNDTFRARCNMGMVEVEELSTEDAVFVAELLEEHIRHTGSRKAKVLIAAWETTLSHFLKVVPLEYRRVMEEARALPEARATRDSLRVLAPNEDPLLGEAQPPSESGSPLEAK
jgi:glutamate synthase domain-containing protein 3